MFRTELNSSLDSLTMRLIPFSAAMVLASGLAMTLPAGAAAAGGATAGAAVGAAATGAAAGGAEAAGAGGAAAAGAGAAADSSPVKSLNAATLASSLTMIHSNCSMRKKEVELHFLGAI